MLRYYSYYSIGGYKDLYLGSSEDKVSETFYLPLLPVLENDAESDPESARLYKELNGLPKIYQLSGNNSYGLPSASASLFSHAGYKLIYRHIQGKTHALALRDISSGSKDEIGRSIPFLMVIIGDSAEDVRKMDVVTTYMASYLKETETALSSFLVYDKEKNGLCFKLADFNAWITKILSEYRSSRVVTSESVICVKGSVNKVALLTLPSGVSLSCAIEEQNLIGFEIESVRMMDVVSKSDIDVLIKRLEAATEELHEMQSSYSTMKKIALGACIGGFLMGLVLRSCSGE